MRSYSDPDELFDVVDDQDRMISHATRREVHARGLLHRAVHVLIHNGEGGLLLQRRSPHKDTFPGCWDSSCSGHLDAGESYATAARRELGEELGWFDESRPFRHVVKLDASAATGWEFIEIFLLGPVEGPFAPNPEEITECRWISPVQLEAELRAEPGIFAGALRHLWSEYRDKILALLSGPESPTL
jgi:isopentenyl-diphosphate delta-isomerase